MQDAVWDGNVHTKCRNREHPPSAAARAEPAPVEVVVGPPLRSSNIGFLKSHDSGVAFIRM